MRSGAAVCTLAVLTVATLAGATREPQNRDRQVKPGVLKGVRPDAVLNPTTLAVREGSGDFTNWVSQGGIEPTALVKQFRWSTRVAGAAGARYEIALGAFPQLPASVNPVNLKKVEHLTLPAVSGWFAVFSVDFTPLLQDIFATASPPEPATFHVRIVPLDSQGQPLPPSYPVQVVYAPPAAGTLFTGATMTVRLMTIRCVEVTDGLGADELRVTVIGRPRKHGAAAETLYAKTQAMNNGQQAHPSASLWTFTGLSFVRDADLLVLLQEVDDFGFSAGELPYNDGQFLAKLTKQECAGDDDCLGDPQELPLANADWHKVTVEKQTVARTMTFKGHGGHYILTFHLSPK